MAQVAPANQKDEIGSEESRDLLKRILRDNEDYRQRLELASARYAKARQWLAMTRACSEDEVDGEIDRIVG